MKTKPDAEGAWWFEHAEDPVIVKRMRACGNRLCVFFTYGWVPVDEIEREGWWSGPLIKPTTEMIHADPS